MRKPDALRAHLVAALPDLARDADRLLLFVDGGSLASTFAPGKSFLYRYTINLIVTDMTLDPDAFMYAVLSWIHAEQPELLATPQRRDEIRFEVDVLANDRCDLSLKLPVDERVIVSQGPDGLQFENPAEPKVPADWVA